MAISRFYVNMVLKTIKIAWIRGKSAKNTPKTPQKHPKNKKNRIFLKKSI